MQVIILKVGTFWFHLTLFISKPENQDQIFFFLNSCFYLKIMHRKCHKESTEKKPSKLNLK